MSFKDVNDLLFALFKKKRMKKYLKCILLMMIVSFPRQVQVFLKKNVHFIKDSTLCHPCGNFIVPINTEIKKKTVLQCMNGIVGILATSVPYEVVAFSDQQL